MEKQSKIALFDKRLNPRIKIRQKSSTKPNRASKSIRKFIVQRQLGWNESFAQQRIPAVIQPIVLSSRRIYKKTSQNSQRLLHQSQISRKTPSQMKYRIRKQSSRSNLYSVRSIPTYYRNDNKKQKVFTPTIIGLQQAISKIYISKQVPKWHINIIKIIRQNLKNKDQQLKLLHTQLRDLQSPQSCIFKLKFLCEQRQHCLQEMKQKVNSLIADKSNFARKISYIRQLIGNIRLLNLACIQKILRRRQIYSQFCTQPKIQVQFQFPQNQNRSYLIKMLYDTEFLYKSQLFQQSCFPDPFFLSYEQNFDVNMKRYSKIRACELLLLEQTL